MTNFLPFVDISNQLTIFRLRKNLHVNDYIKKEKLHHGTSLYPTIDF